MAKRYYYRIVFSDGSKTPSRMGSTLAAALKQARTGVHSTRLEACVERARVLPHGRQGEWHTARCVRGRGRY